MTVSHRGFQSTSISMLGFILALSASVLSSGKDVFSKRLSISVNSSLSTFASFAFPLPLYLAVLAILSLSGVPVFAVGEGFWRYAVARAVTDTGAEWCKMKALTLGDLSVVTSFFALYPVLLLLSSPLLTGDALEPRAPLGTAIIVIGTLVILYRRSVPASRGGDAPASWKAIALSLLAAVFFSLNTALDRATVQQGHPVFSAFVMTIMSAMIVSVSLRRGASSELIRYKKLFAGRGVLEVMFMIAKLSALTILSAPMVVGISRLSTVLNVLAGHFVFGEKHLGRRLFGAALVCGGVVYLVIGA